MTQSVDPAAFKAFEHDGWQAVYAGYHDAFGDLTTQAVGPLLDAVGAGPGVRLLDVATGPGYVARAAAHRGAGVVGVDFSAAMVALARRLHPGLEFAEGDAEALALPDRSFDAVVMNFGLLHLARPEQALAEACRVLRPGGRLAFTVWSKPEEAVGFRIVLRAVEAHGDLSVTLPPGPPFFRFSDPEECHRTLTAAGFTALRVTTVPQVWRLASADALMEAIEGSTVRTRALLWAQRPEALAAIRAAVRAAVGAYQRGRAIELPMPAVLASAAKPTPHWPDSERSFPPGSSPDAAGQSRHR